MQRTDAANFEIHLTIHIIRHLALLYAELKNPDNPGSESDRRNEYDR